MKKIFFIKLLVLSFVLILIVEWSLLYWGAPTYLAGSSHRGYIVLFTLWSSLIGAPIVAMVIFSLAKGKRSRSHDVHK
ncbi:hypothetical protein [Ammoniphilus sp. CFH 90114]|uniref:hypothetical protein n=1 Tax=Ammoniphilus sp. CFH 90114 TaxID=2493665 RepID=UPI00100E3448|nr:hypothetical protein [Ammoniphilus sp. CFH 90114]RXT07796.1 hypothetical protein EIZ39_10215 [Ammoniphilus sp. CFH 90114]